MISPRNNIGIITKPLGNGGIVPVSNLVNICSHISNSLLVITGNEGAKINPRWSEKVTINSFRYVYGKNSFEKMANNLVLQVKVAFSILRWHNSINTWIFFLDSHVFILPVIVAKLLGSRIIFPLAASIKGSAKVQNSWLNSLLMLFESITFYFADCIILYSENLISDWNLNHYNDKIFIAHEHLVNFDRFTVTTPLSDRPPLIGYIGRLSVEKGVQNLTQALPTILGNRQDLRVLIGGDGQLKGAIEISLLKEGVAPRVALLGWISHNDLPNYLNQLRLLVLPSSSEGLPNILLEAMACGTPVLATPVGAIPDVILDGITGFIMENNSPECIAENVARALNSPNLGLIAESGRQFIEENFTFDRTVEDWRRVLQGVR